MLARFRTSPLAGVRSVSLLRALWIHFVVGTFLLPSFRLWMSPCFPFGAVINGMPLWILSRYSLFTVNVIFGIWESKSTTLLFVFHLSLLFFVLFPLLFVFLLGFKQSLLLKYNMCTEKRTIKSQWMFTNWTHNHLQIKNHKMTRILRDPSHGPFQAPVSCCGWPLPWHHNLTLAFLIFPSMESYGTFVFGVWCVCAQYFVCEIHFYSWV